MNERRGKPNKRPNRGIGRRWGACLLAGALAASVIVPASPANEAAAETAQGSYTQDQLDGLAYLNEIRAKVGVGPLVLDPGLTRASQAHAQYYNLHRTKGVSAHNETEGAAGFTGATPGQRGKAAGWPNTSVAEVMSFGNGTTKEAVDSWLSTAYHRDIILDERYEAIGIGLQNGTAVMNPAFLEFRHLDSEANVYPYDGMKGADVGFYGAETPNPLDRLGVEYSGGIISATAAWSLDAYEAKIVDAKGNEVPFRRELKGGTVFLYPEDVLDSYSLYTVTLNYVATGETQRRSKTWSFTTGRGPALNKLSAQYEELVMNPGSKLKIEAIAGYGDGTQRKPKETLAYSSSSPSGLKVSKEGVLEAVKPGDYKVTLSFGSVRKVVPVKVFSRLKNKNYPATDPAKAKDLNGHPDRAAIEWALRSGIAAADTKGNFRPNDTVTEAQFLIMLLRTYKVDDESYAPKKKKHAADGAYQVAKERGLLLFSTRAGNASFRDKPMNRYRAAGLIASADGVNFDFTEAVDYVLARDYMRGTQGNQNSTFGSNDTITRAQAAVILMKLQSEMKQLVGAPSSITPRTKLPEDLFPEIYVKPVLENRTLIAEFKADGTLVVEGRFRDQGNRQLELQVDSKSEDSWSGDKLETISVSTDGEGRFSVSAKGSYDEERLSVFLRTENVTYYIGVKRGTMNASDFSS